MTRPGAPFRALAAGCAGVLTLVAADGAGTALAAPVLVAGIPDDGVWGLVSWIVGAAVIGGALGYGLATLAAPEALSIALVFGTATGGGLGALVRVFAVGGTEQREPESVHIGSTDDEDGSPDPQPADLFDEHPDPVLYFDDAGDGPVVRAANAAFEETFGVGTDTVANAALADASMTTERVDALVAAVGDGETFDAVLTCETDGETAQFRVRTATVTDDTGTRGYLLYTPPA